jgi:hypothetical protein
MSVHEKVFCRTLGAGIWAAFWIVGVETSILNGQAGRNRAAQEAVKRIEWKYLT